MNVFPPDFINQVDKITKSQIYIKNFLTPHIRWVDIVPYKTRFETLLSDANKCNWGVVTIYINHMPYHDFLSTMYWEAISKQKKFYVGHCEDCGTKYNLDVHHPNYDILGHELWNMNELKVLCHDCHGKEHIRLVEEDLNISQQKI